MTTPSFLAMRLRSELAERLAALGGAVKAAPMRPLLGRVERAGGLLARARLPNAAIGEFVRLFSPSDPAHVATLEPRLAQIVGFDHGQALLAVLGGLEGLGPDSLAAPWREGLEAPAGDGLLGRVIDGLGRPLDAARKGPLPNGLARRPVSAPAPTPLERPTISEVFKTGVAAIDGFLTLGRGQRVGLFGEAGLGKSRLMADLVRFSSADVAVVALVGERGREVSEFIDDALGPEGLARAVIVASTSDRSSVERARAPFVATAIAEHFRDQGKDVLLVLDSLTRLARAQREIGLAAGEAPARRAFPPSVFTLLPSLIERAGRTEAGSITAVYTTLVEGEDGVDDPIAEEARSLLDGHIVLSRRLAEAGRFPAIDVLASRSRLMDRIVAPAHAQAARRLRALMAKRREVDLLVSVGEYVAGADALADEAIAKADKIEFLARPELDGEAVDFDRLIGAMAALAEGRG